MSLWNEEYSCAPYVEPKVGNHYIMQHARTTRPVFILGVFSELIVVRHNEAYMTLNSVRFEEAVSRRQAGFLEIPSLGAEVASASDADTPVE